MIVLKDNTINEVLMTIGHLHVTPTYELKIKDTFGQYSKDLELTELGGNQQLVSVFEIEVVQDLIDEDLTQNKIFLKKNTRYIYELFNDDDIKVGIGYLIVTEN
jgi:hypothetical protein